MYKVLHLGLSYNCNMKCEHCFVRKKENKITFEDIKNVIDWLSDNNLLIMYYTYGEPLLSNIFSKVSEYVSQKGIVQILMTNGSVIDKEKIILIKRNKINTVYISIDHSLPTEHDKNRNYKGAFEKAIKAIRLCKQAGINVGISTTVTKNNIKSLKEIYNLALKEDVKIISFLRERTESGIAPFTKEENKTYIDFFKFCLQQKNVNVKFHDTTLIKVLDFLYQENIIDKDTFDKYNCMNACHSQNTISVSPDGEISHCNLIKNPFGNVINQSTQKLHENYDKELSYESVIHCSTFS